MTNITAHNPDTNDNQNYWDFVTSPASAEGYYLLIEDDKNWRFYPSSYLKVDLSNNEIVKKISDQINKVYRET